MSPRPRRHTDEEILEAAAEAVSWKPADWTLADIGDRVGLSPATLVQRFGSKDALEHRLIAFLNERDDFLSQSQVGDLIDVTCQGKLENAGLLTFRLIAATTKGYYTRALAMGEA